MSIQSWIKALSLLLKYLITLNQKSTLLNQSAFLRSNVNQRNKSVEKSVEITVLRIT